MKLYSSPISPFSRKVRVVAFATKIPLEVVDVNLADPTSPLRQANPLAKVPALVVNPSLTLCDSTLICEYLNANTKGATVIPTDASKRWQHLEWEAIVDGALDAVVLIRMEGMRDLAHQDPSWIKRQSEKVEASLNYLEDQIDQFQTDFSNPASGIAEIALACGLEYIALRFPDNTWLTKTPKLKAWAAKVYLHPWMTETRAIPTN